MVTHAAAGGFSYHIWQWQLLLAIYIHRNLCIYTYEGVSVWSDPRPTQPNGLTDLPLEFSLCGSSMTRAWTLISFDFFECLSIRVLLLLCPLKWALFCCSLGLTTLRRPNWALLWSLVTGDGVLFQKSFSVLRSFVLRISLNCAAGRRTYDRGGKENSLMCGFAL